MKQSYYDRPDIASRSPIMTGQVSYETVLLCMTGQVSHQEVQL